MGTGSGTTTIAATVTRGADTISASASLLVAGTRDTFAYWDGNGNGDLTCTEAKDKDDGLRLPAYKDNRDGTGLIYEWLERGRASDSDDDGISCETTQNPSGYVPARVTVPPTQTGDRTCPTGSPTWMGLPVCEEAERTGYDRDVFGTAYTSLEDEIINGLPKSGEQVYTPYSCKLFDIRADGTAATDIDHIVALAEAYDSGLPDSQFRTFAGDLANLHCGSGREPATEIRPGRRRLEAVAKHRLVCRPSRGRQAEVRPVRESSRAGCAGVDARIGLKPLGDLQLSRDGYHPRIREVRQRQSPRLEHCNRRKPTSTRCTNSRDTRHWPPSGRRREPASSGVGLTAAYPAFFCWIPAISTWRTRSSSNGKNGRSCSPS